MATQKKLYIIKYIGTEFHVEATSPKKAVVELLKKRNGSNLNEVNIYEADDKMCNCVVIRKITNFHHDVYYYTLQFTLKS